MGAAAYHDTTFEENPGAFQRAREVYASRNPGNSCSLNIEGGACTIGMAGPGIGNQAPAVVNKGPDLDLA